MAKEIDVYRDWLGVTETARPLDYYQLLRLKSFEDGLAKIREHYRKMNAHVRKFATGDYAAQSQALLNELAKAMLCLTDVARKREYDASLGRKDVGEGKRRAFEEVLLAGKLLDGDQLAKARNFAEATGLEVREAVLQQKLASPEAVMAAYAESVGLPYVELAEIGVDPQLAPQVPPTLARQHSCVPVMQDDGQALVASPRPLIPEVEEELRLRFGMPVRTVLCTAADINAAIAKHYSGEAAAAAAAPAKKAASKKAAAAKAEEDSEAAPLSEEEQSKRRLMFSIIAFNVTVVVCMIVAILLRGGMNMLGTLDFFLVLVAALAAGGTTFGVTTAKKI
jgi:hypothetical protein